jgi:hypothetical protein
MPPRLLYSVNYFHDYHNYEQFVNHAHTYFTHQILEQYSVASSLFQVVLKRFLYGTKTFELERDCNFALEIRKSHASPTSSSFTLKPVRKPAIGKRLQG